MDIFRESPLLSRFSVDRTSSVTGSRTFHEKWFKWLQLSVPHQKSQGWVVQRLANSATQSQAFAEIRLAFLPLQQDGSSNRQCCTQLTEEESPGSQPKLCFILGKKKLVSQQPSPVAEAGIGLPDPY